MNAVVMSEPLERRQHFAIGPTPPHDYAPFFEIVHNDLTAHWFVPLEGGKKVYPPSSTLVVTPSVSGGVWTQTVSAETTASRVALDAKGILTLRGSRKHDAFEVYSTGTRIEIAVRSGKNKTAPVYVGNYDAADVKGIVVEGYGGSDVLHVNAATHAFTRDVNIETRTLERPNGATLANLASTPLPGVYAGSTEKWLTRSQQQIATAAKADADVALLGDSMLSYFTQTGAAVYAKTFGPHAVDLGLPGDTTSQLLYRVQNHGLLDGLSPRLVVLNVGTNNATLSDDAKGIEDGIGTVLAVLRKKLPTAKILLLGILPQHRPTADPTIDKINAALAALDNGVGVRFVSGTNAFASSTAAAKYYKPGEIHLNSRGYAVWAGLIAPAVAEMAGWAIR